jgi:RHS repeat-associated protein
MLPFFISNKLKKLSDLISIFFITQGACLQSPDLPTDKLFTGQRLDGTGLYYYNARYYDPTIGRFISPDTVIQNPANPQCLNRYTYCLNNPLKYNDPSGFSVTLSNSAITAAFILLWETDPDAANQLINSSINFEFTIGSIDSIAETKPVSLDQNRNVTGVLVTLSNNHFDLEKEGIKGLSYIMAHETVHCISYDLYKRVIFPTFYEEVIAMKYQYEFGQKIGYSPYSHPWWQFWAGSTDMQGSQKMVLRALKVRLVNGPSSELDQELIDAFKNTSYWDEYLQERYYAYFSDPEYWVRMNQLAVY